MVLENINQAGFSPIGGGTSVPQCKAKALPPILEQCPPEQ